VQATSVIKNNLVLRKKRCNLLLSSRCANVPTSYHSVRCGEGESMLLSDCWW